mmetsp:Transcript_19594/g.42201  ORF Transcript_19594/g.42201 Transcript_19594/m.42201 type:complete len:224 (+) Transcript_19594:380-1051(+)
MSVVAPTTARSPRASCGLRMEAASMAPPASPAPITECSSSMKRITCPAESVTSRSTALSRSSNSPRYLAPAMREATSRAITFFSRMESGTSRSAMRWARPSTTAVLPTPGSPMSTGLFFRRRESTCTVRRISSSRPSTGSSLPLRASAVRSVPYLFSDSPLGVASGFTQAEPLPPPLLPPPPPPPAELPSLRFETPVAEESAREPRMHATQSLSTTRRPCPRE